MRLIYISTRSLGKIKSKENKKLRQGKGIEVMGGFLKGVEYKCNTGTLTLLEHNSNYVFIIKEGEKEGKTCVGSAKLFL